MIYLFTAIGLTPSGSSTVYIYIQAIHRTTKSTQTIHRTTQLTNWEERGPCPIFVSYTLAYTLQLRKKHGKTSKKKHRKPSGKSTENPAATTTDVPLKLTHLS